MAHQALSKDEIMRELNSITADLALLIKATSTPYEASIWDNDYAKSMFELRQRLHDLHVPICRLPKSTDRIEANTYVKVLMRLIQY